MRNLLLLLFFSTSGILYGAHTANTDSTHLGNSKWLLKIPFIHAGFNASIIGSSESILQQKFALEGLGSGLWYFPKGRFSYQLNADFRLNLGEYAAPSQILKSDAVQVNSFFKGYGYYSPQFSFNVNYEMADKEMYKMYAFASFQWQTAKWWLRKLTIPGGATPVGGTPYQGIEYDGVYKLRLSKNTSSKGFRAGIAWAVNKNIMVARVFTEATLPGVFTYNATPIASDLGQVLSWEANSKWDLAFGLSLEFNTNLHNFIPSKKK